MIRIAAILAVLFVPLPPPGPGPTYPGPTPPTYPAVAVLSVGDSLTADTDSSPTGSYRGELSRLWNLAGQPHTWITAAIGGTKCSWWAGQIEDLIAAHQPDLLVIGCGTNDTAADDTQADYTTILDAAQAHGVQVVAVLPGVPDMRAPNMAWPGIDESMHSARQAELAAIAGRGGVVVADVQRVPATLEWLQPDGVHWVSRTEAAVAWLIYDAARVVYGWPVATEPCGLSGSWMDDPEPVPAVDYLVCSRR